MREVLDNRLSAANSSELLRSYVACNPTTNDMRGVVQANTCGRARLPQFAGFDGARSAPDEKQLDVITKIFEIANVGTHGFFDKTRAHVEKAIEIASRPTQSSTITESSLIFWRTARSDPPSAYATQRLALAGQFFFSLSNSYLKNPQNPAKP